MQASWGGYNRDTMSQQVTFEVFALRSRWGGLVAALFAVATVLCVSSAGFAQERGRVRSHESSTGACWGAAPTVCVDVTACPAVTSPEATVARFSILPLSLIATVVDVRAVHDVAVARIGGLYGP